jgi:hypothetical protein
MNNQQIQAYCRRKGFHPKTQERWLELNEADREALLALVETLKAGENHFKDLLDWLEEISVRDGVGVALILSREDLSRVASDPRLGRSDRLKRLKEEVRRLRFPRLARIEDEIRRRVRAMKLDPKILLAVPAGLEGGAVTIQMKAAGYDELKRLSAEVARVVEDDGMKEIFALLRGEIQG